VGQYAEVCNKLMLALGYNEYITQGGDWGSLITRKMAQVYGGTHSKGWHTNMPMYVFIVLQLTVHQKLSCPTYTEAKHPASSGPCRSYPTSFWGTLRKRKRDSNGRCYSRNTALDISRSRRHNRRR
jgi:hypothetical protein